MNISLASGSHFLTVSIDGFGESVAHVECLLLDVCYDPKGNKKPFNFIQKCALSKSWTQVVLKRGFEKRNTMKSFEHSLYESVQPGSLSKKAKR